MSCCPLSLSACLSLLVPRPRWTPWEATDGATKLHTPITTTQALSRAPRQGAWRVLLHRPGQRRHERRALADPWCVRGDVGSDGWGMAWNCPVCLVPIQSPPYSPVHNNSRTPRTPTQMLPKTCRGSSSTTRAPPPPRVRAIRAPFWHRRRATGRPGRRLTSTASTWAWIGRVSSRGSSSWSGACARRFGCGWCGYSPQPSHLLTHQNPSPSRHGHNSDAPLAIDPLAEGRFQFPNSTAASELPRTPAEGYIPKPEVAMVA